MKDFRIVVVVTTKWQGEWTKTDNGWKWDGPARVRIKDPSYVLDDFCSCNVTAGFVLKDHTYRGPAKGLIDNFEECATYTVEHSAGTSIESVGDRELTDTSSSVGS